MTEENKTNILNYITGDYQITSPDTQEIFLEQGLMNKDIWRPFLPPSWNSFRFEGMVAPDETTTPLGVLYGGYIDNDNNVLGIIILINQDFVPVKTIYEYDSGTPLRYIQYMKQAEDGTFYFIDDTAFTPTQNQQVMTSQKRFVMVNNFTLETNGDYILKLRTSYIFSGNYVNFYCKNMFKDPNSSHYIFFGACANINSSSYAYSSLKIFGLKVNVGEANVWTMYVNENTKIFGSAIAMFNEENVKFRCLVADNLPTNKNISLYEKTYTGSPTNRTVFTADYKPYIDGVYYRKQSVFLDYDTVYFVQNNQHWGNSGTIEPKYIGLYVFYIEQNAMGTIYENYLGDYDYCNLEAIYIDKCGSQVYVQYNNNIDNSQSTPLADYYFQRLTGDKWNPILISEQSYFQYNFRTIFVKANYNLLQIYLYGANPRIVSAWFYYFIKEDYNPLNYNSIPYNSYKSMIGNKGEVFSNGSIVFARNLYNRTQWNNTTTSTIQIPNTYLNNMILQPKKLLSSQNNVINNDTDNLTKNIYESVLLNYVNSISVIDEDTGSTYPNGATFINTNINTGTKTNHENTLIGKIRTNYENGSTTQNILWEIIDDTHKQATFSIYVSSPLTSIDFISDDETFIYLTKEYDNLEVGKYYTITQKLRIE